MSYQLYSHTLPSATPGTHRIIKAHHFGEAGAHPKIYFHPKGSGTRLWKTVPKHARKHEAHPPRVKKEKKKKEEFRLDSDDFGII